LNTLGNMGAETVSVPWEDVYTSLQTNMIDGVVTNFDGFDTMSFYESAPNVLVAPELWYSTPHMHTINMDTWEELPEDIQEGILKASEIAEDKFGDIYEKELDKLIEEEKDAGINIKKIEGEEINLFADEDFLETQREKWIKELQEKHGDDNGQEYVDKLEKII